MNWHEPHWEYQLCISINCKNPKNLMHHPVLFYKQNRSFPWALLLLFLISFLLQPSSPSLLPRPLFSVAHSLPPSTHASSTYHTSLTTICLPVSGDAFCIVLPLTSLALPPPNHRRGFCWIVSHIIAIGFDGIVAAGKWSNELRQLGRMGWMVYSFCMAQRRERESYLLIIWFMVQVDESLIILINYFLIWD